MGVYFGVPGVWGWPWAVGFPSGYSAYYPYPVAGATDWPVSVEPQSAPATTESLPPAQSLPPTSYWYYCEDPAGYFPYVQRCAKPWIPVLPRNVPPGYANPEGSAGAGRGDKAPAPTQ